MLLKESNCMIPPRNPGDVFLLFYDLPYDFNVDLPLIAGPDVYLDRTPQEVLDHRYEDEGGDKEHRLLVSYVLPGYGLPGMGVVHCCLRCPGNLTAKLGPLERFFLSIGALRLRKPIGIRVAGVFKLGQGDDLIKDPGLFHLTSSWQPNAEARYSAEDIEFGAKIAERTLHLWNLKCKRLNNAIVFFSQVTYGLIKSFQMAYLALFCALEALFVPTENKKAISLANRTANFLSCFPFPEPPLNDWLRDAYIRRSNLAHGKQEFIPLEKAPLSEEKQLAFGRLHEITRLSILGFMSLADNQLESLSKGSGKKLQKELDSIVPASGQFIDGQQMWCAEFKDS